MASILWIPVFFASATALLYFLTTQLPTSAADSSFDTAVVKFPSSLQELSALSAFLSSYKQEHLSHVVILFSCAYLYKQTFAIPGSVFMNILAGALFGPWIGFPMTCFLSASGASCCYLLCKYFGKQHVIRYFPQKIQAIEEKIEENSDSLFFYLLFLRLFPMSPNWLMNLAAPIVGIPIHLFFLSVFVGLMPYNYICVQTGCMLSQITSLQDMFTIYTTVKLLAIAIVALVPGLLIRKLKERKDLRHSRLQ